MDKGKKESFLSKVFLSSDFFPGLLPSLAFLVLGCVYFAEDPASYQMGSLLPFH